MNVHAEAYHQNGPEFCRVKYKNSKVLLIKRNRDKKWETKVRTGGKMGVFATGILVALHRFIMVGLSNCSSSLDDGFNNPKKINCTFMAL